MYLKQPQSWWAVREIMGILSIILTLVFYVSLFVLVGLSAGAYLLVKENQELLTKLLELLVPLAANTTRTLSDTTVVMKEVRDVATRLTEVLQHDKS